MAEMLCKHCEVQVVTSCYDLFDMPIKGLEEGVDTLTFSYAVHYINPQKATRAFWKETANEFNPDIVWVSGIFSLPFSIKPILALYKSRKIIVSPRGMLHNSALAIKPIKKKVFLFLAKVFRIVDAVFWHATNEEEKYFVKTNSGVSSDKVLVLNNIPSSLKECSGTKKIEKVLHLLMPARIAPEKNNVFALEALEATANKTIELTFCGADGGGKYSELFHAKLKHLQAAGFKLTYVGVKPPIEIEKDFFPHSHYMYLPSRGENFGHAISEALACNTPVILSDKTPWNAVQTYGVGKVVSLDVLEHAAALNAAFEQNSAEYQGMLEKCHPFLQEHSALKTLEKNYLSVIESICNA